MTTNWRDVLVAWLHDPPDKALQISTHQSRARSYLHTALGDSVSEAELKDPSDPAAAIAERLPAPRWETRKVSGEQSCFLTRHPLSAAERKVTTASWSQAAVSAQIAQLVESVDDTEGRFLVLWRRLEEQLSREAGEWFEQLPADTRIPDHTIWQHLDTTAAFKAAEAGSGATAAFLSFSIGPVQSFIEAAKSLRDLWSGSMILAWLTFQGMLPVLDRLGPTALIYPALRGLPWLDIWLRQKHNLTSAIESPPPQRRVAPCLPNRFLAVVPWGLDGCVARELAAACRQRAHEAWAEMARAVRTELNRDWESLAADWSARWQEQIGSFFDVRTAVLPWRDCSDDTAGRLLTPKGGFQDAFPDAAKVRSLAEAIPPGEQPGYAQKSAGSWQAKVELSARLMQAQRSVRHVPPSTAVQGEDETFPPKCSLLGSYEQMGPAGLSESAKFWQRAAQTSPDGVRLRERERLGAVALVKRFVGPCYFRDQLDLKPEDFRYEDTASVAAACWLKKHPRLNDHARKARSSQWLHWSSPRQGEKDGEAPIRDDIWNELRAARRKEPPPAYYAVLMLDGDELGRWLRGDNSPQVREVLHPDLLKYFTDLPAAAAGLDARRPVSPALHAAISEALANFALHFVPPIVEKHAGTLIYAGGDDVLAVLPAKTALNCAGELSKTFRENWKRDEPTGRERLLMGRRATVSAGLAIVHHKEDLRFALDAARQAEKAAKKAGRDALQIAACRRSGEHSSAFCPWDLTPELSEWIDKFSPPDEASDRWAYHLRRDLPTLRALPVEAMKAEIRRQIGRSRDRGKLAFAPDAMLDAFERYRQALFDEKRRPKDDGFTGRLSTDQARDPELNGRALEGFIMLCQTASFLARGRDE